MLISVRTNAAKPPHAPDFPAILSWLAGYLGHSGLGVIG